MRKLRYFIATKLMRIVEWLDPFVQRRNVIVETTHYRLKAVHLQGEITRGRMDAYSEDPEAFPAFARNIKRTLGCRVADKYATMEEIPTMEGGVIFRAEILVPEKIDPSLPCPSPFAEDVEDWTIPTR